MRADGSCEQTSATATPDQSRGRTRLDRGLPPGDKARVHNSETEECVDGAGISALLNEATSFVSQLVRSHPPAPRIVLRYCVMAVI